MRGRHDGCRNNAGKKRTAHGCPKTNETEDYAFWMGFMAPVHEEFRRWRCNLGDFWAGRPKILWGDESQWSDPLEMPIFRGSALPGNPHGTAVAVLLLDSHFSQSYEDFHDAPRRA